VWEHILGIRPESEGLRIDPCLPSHWTRAKMTRNYRGATHQIDFEKHRGICRGKVVVGLDGKTLPSNVIPPQGDGKRNEVVVRIS
jgi:cellobiose phosphorylase